MKKLKRILLINSEYPPISGGGIYTYNLANGIASNYSDLQLIVLAGARDISSISLEENPLPNLKILRYPELYLIDQGMTHIWKVSSIIKGVISSYCPDVVHSHHTYESFAASLCKQFYKFGLMITVQKSPVSTQEDYQKDSQWDFISFLYKKGFYDGVIVNSKAYFDTARFLGAREPIRLVYYGIDKSNFREDTMLRNQVRKKLCLEKDDFLVLCPSRIDERKGIDILIEAIAKIKKIAPHVYLKMKVIVVGAKISDSSEDYFCSLEHLVKRYNLTRLVKLGYEDGAYNKMNGLYNASDLVVIPSLREGLGFSAIEAMQVKKPVLGSDTIGLKEIIVDQKNGLTFRVGDPIQLAEKLIWCFNNKKKLQEIALSGFSYQKDKFTISKMVKEHLSFYESVISVIRD